MKILIRNNDLNEALLGNSNVGFVPTMGSLHKGHISLIKKSLAQCSKTIVSIFVNPTQFNDKNDYKKYPRNLKNDLKILKKLKINFVYIPIKNQIYNSKNKIKIHLLKKDKILCAKYRKNHFEGVVDVMTRLTKIIKPSKIFMGEKDFQQLFLVKRYIEKYFKSKIISCKTIRDKNKLALSSRNLLLKKKSLIKARNISNDLISFKKKLFKKTISKKLVLMKKDEIERSYNVKIEYLEIRKIKNLQLANKIKNSKIFVAYYLGNIRLIDNF